MSTKPLTLLVMSALLPLHLACTTPAPKPSDDTPKEQTTAPKDNATTPASITGNYSDEHVVMVMGEDDQEVEEQVIDCLSLKEDGESLSFDVMLVQDNEHSCSLSGKAAKQADGTFLYTEEIEDQGTCKLLITVKDATIELTDVEEICRTYYCGMRASFDGATFKRNTQDTLLKACTMR